MGLELGLVAHLLPLQLLDPLLRYLILACQTQLHLDLVIQFLLLLGELIEELLLRFLLLLYYDLVG